MGAAQLLNAADNHSLVCFGAAQLLNAADNHSLVCFGTTFIHASVANDNSLVQ